MRDVIDDLVAALDEGRPCVACLLVETRGSTPQKAGAAMLVFPDGGQAGTLGGGCVEAEVRRRVLAGLPKPEIFTFNLDDDYGWDDGLICGGRMTVLAHPLPATTSDETKRYFRRYREFIASGEACLEAITIQEDAGRRFLFDATGNAAFGEVPEQVRVHLPDLTERPKPQVKSGVAYLPTAERVRLLIVGGGHVGQAVAELAARVDFDIWVLDDREKYANAGRFPAASRIIVDDIGRGLQTLIAEQQITRSTFGLIVTRGHNHDEEALYHLATTSAGYVGMIGSRRKIRLIFDDLITKGIPAEVLQRVHAPLGLPIGSQTVPEIAVSIVAELIQCRNAPAATPCSR